MTTPPEPTGLRRNGRFRRILIFFARIILHLILWDIIGGRIPWVKTTVRRTRAERFRRFARRFRAAAVEMGGVMIKMGQFFSSRVDVLPPEITEELQGLQDEVPPEPTARIFAVLRAELGELDGRFAKIEAQPLAAASLGQAHRAWLLPENGDGRGQDVVVKVQRPGIEEVVRTDLAALRIVAQWTMRYPPIRRRADVPALMDEFARTLWEELDYEAEADNAERFAAMYAGDDSIIIPAVHREHSTGRVIVLENVTAIKITDVDGLTAVDIDPVAVADKLLDAYFRQIFVEGFFHADPHPGNLFIQPCDGDEGEGERPFALVFVDFGMVGRVPDLMGENLRKVLVSITQRDAHKLTEAYDDLGFFLPGADLERITQAQATVLDRIWGRNLLDLARPDPKEVQELGMEFRDLLFDFPFQVPQDFIYLGRAMGMVSGLVSLLNPDVNPWYQIEKFAEELVLKKEVREFGLEAALSLARRFLAGPAQVQRVLSAAESGHKQRGGSILLLQ
ncbi:MAG: ABC1 kinase family protein [Anaerolineae bacterium]